MERGEYAETKETICLFLLERRRIDMKFKFTLFNFEFDDSNKSSRKVNKKSPKRAILETFFITLLVTIAIEVIKFLISCL